MGKKKVQINLKIAAVIYMSNVDSRQVIHGKCSKTKHFAFLRFVSFFVRFDFAFKYSFFVLWMMLLFLLYGILNYKFIEWNRLTYTYNNKSWMRRLWWMFVCVRVCLWNWVFGWMPVRKICIDWMSRVRKFIMKNNK